jgi:DNA-binding response OmpR family regulator
MRDLVGVKVVLVEDESAVALAIEDMIQDLGCELVGSVASLARAQQIMGSESFDVAVLDVNVRGEAVFPIAYLLVERGIPFLFSTGYGQGAIPQDLANHPAITKPFSIETLARAMSAALMGVQGMPEGQVGSLDAKYLSF